MSRLLSDLLGAREPSFTQLINRLESESGHTGVDLHLTSDISKKIRIKLRELGLDPNDTNGQELYHALQSLVKKHDEFLAKKIGTNSADSTDKVIKKVIEAAQKLPVPKTSWVLRHSAAKRLLQQLPPKRVMKQLRYRSLDSLLKRANIDEVFAAIYMVEAVSWQEKFIANYKKLSPSDFESRKVNIIALDPKKWGDLAEKFVRNRHHNIISVPEMGVVAVLPLPVEELPGLTITLLPLIVYHINLIRSVSSYLKLHQVKSDFNSHFVKAVTGLLHNSVTLCQEPLAWDIIHKHFGKPSQVTQPEAFMPHIQIEDLRWQGAEDVLFKLEPALKFWEGLDYVSAPFVNRPVPLGLLDNAISFCNDLEYGEHSIIYSREALRRELFSRYIDQPELEDQVTKQFDDGVVEVDIFAMIDRGIG